MRNSWANLSELRMIFPATIPSNCDGFGMGNVRKTEASG